MIFTQWIFFHFDVILIYVKLLMCRCWLFKKILFKSEL